MSAPAWNQKFELPDGSYFILDIQNYFEYVLKKHGEKTVNLSIRICMDKIENRITFKIEFEKWRALCASVSGVGGVLPRVSGWHDCIGCEVGM